MLYFPLITKNQEFIKYFAERQMTKGVVFVTPNPIKADLLRHEFDLVGEQIESITISKFIRDKLAIAGKKLERDFNYQGKSELLITLGAIWKKMSLGNEYADFKRSFNLLTEFRSFSTELSVLETVLENYEEEVQQGVLWLYRFLEQLEIVDEHKSYFILADLVEKDVFLQNELSENIVLFGFDFITGSQIDLIKTLSKKRNVTIPLYKEVYERSSMVDWPSWFSEDAELVDLTPEHIEEKEASLGIFPKNYLGKTVGQIFQQDQINSILVGNADLSYEIVQEFPINKLEVKYQFGIFEDIYYNICKRLEKTLNFKMETNELLINIDKFIIAAIERAEFRELKVLLLFKQTIQNWFELSDENLSVNLFDLKIFNEAVFLDLPRLNFANLSSHTITRLDSLKTIESLSEKKSLFVMTSSYPGPGVRKNNYTENLEKYLSSVGPIRRSEFDLLLLKAKINEYTLKNQVMFLIEDGLLEHSADLNFIFEDIALEMAGKYFFSKSNKKYLESQISKHKLDNISATKLQRYIDCPRKYALNYLLHYSKKVKIQNYLNPIELGRIEHSVIESYFQSNAKEFNLNILESSINRYLKSYFPQQNIQFKKYFYEIKAFTIGVIKFLTELKYVKNADLVFEVPFERICDGIKYNGSVDCLVKINNTFLVLDFKRSNYSFLSYNNLLDFEQIQLWFYANCLNENNIIDVQNFGIGYIDLSEIENSTFVVSSMDLGHAITEINEKIKVKMVPELMLRLEEYMAFEKDKMKLLQNDSSFLPNPKNEKSCKFCVGEQICARKAFDEGEK